MALTKGEMVICAGRMIERIGEKLDDPNTPMKIELSEALEILKETATDVIKEYQD